MHVSFSEVEDQKVYWTELLQLRAWLFDYNLSVII